MTYEEVVALLEYHYWARDRTLAALDSVEPELFARQLDGSFQSIRNTIVHIYAADLVWYSRWRGNSPTSLISAGKFSDVPALRSAWIDLEHNVWAFLHQVGNDGIRRKLEYNLFNGRPAGSPLWQTLQHVVNHASYYRGQITTLLRQIDAAPPAAMDLITFYRDREARLPDQGAPDQAHGD